MQLTESIEKEIKIMLQEVEFYTLKDYLEKKCTKVTVKNQINYYFDTNSYYLKKNNYSFRVRYSNGNYELTLKKRIKKVLNKSIKNELNIQITNDIFHQIMDKGISRNQNRDLFDVLLENSTIPIDSTIQLLGELKTFRQFYYVNEFEEPLILDISYYLNKVDYEMEWEVDNLDDSIKNLEKIFDELQIKINTNSVSKSTRFFVASEYL